MIIIVCLLLEFLWKLHSLICTPTSICRCSSKNHNHLLWELPGSGKSWVEADCFPVAQWPAGRTREEGGEERECMLQTTAKHRGKYLQSRNCSGIITGCKQRRWMIAGKASKQAGETRCHNAAVECNNNQLSSLSSSIIISHHGGHINSFRGP